MSTELHIAVLEDARDPTVLELIGASPDMAKKMSVLLDFDQSVLDKKFRNLSLGEQKLCLIARALAAKPKLLILDEAVQGLDLQHRTRVARLIDSMVTSPDFDVAVVFVTHHVDELPRVVTHRLFMQAGSVSSRGPWKP